MRLARPVAALCAMALLLPAAAGAQSAPFAPLPSAPPAPPETVTVPPPGIGDDDGGLSDLQQVLIVLAGVALVLGIGFAIARDARNVAPVTEEDRLPKPDRKGTVAPQQRKRAREAGKRAKAARKTTKRRSKR